MESGLYIIVHVLTSNLETHEDKCHCQTCSVLVYKAACSPGHRLCCLTQIATNLNAYSSPTKERRPQSLYFQNNIICLSIISNSFFPPHLRKGMNGPLTTQTNRSVSRFTFSGFESSMTAEVSSEAIALGMSAEMKRRRCPATNSRLAQLSSIPAAMLKFGDHEQ